MNNQLECRIAQSEKERDQVYRLRYQCYRRDGSIPGNSSESFRDLIDSEANHFSFIAADDGTQPVATMRISVVRPDLGWHDSPGLHVFGDHPALGAIANESFVEASRLCFAAQARRDAFFALIANMSAMADFYEVNWLVACPRLEHADVYRNLFGFQTLAEPRQYYGVMFKTELLAIRRSILKAHVAKRRVMREASENALQQLTHNQIPVLLHASSQMLTNTNSPSGYARR